jgi:hypothetical protein
MKSKNSINFINDDDIVKKLLEIVVKHRETIELSITV